jgi:hypothetical protein
MIILWEYRPRFGGNCLSLGERLPTISRSYMKKAGVTVTPRRMPSSRPADLWASLLWRHLLAPQGRIVDSSSAGVLSIPHR